jgi:hypothetical protein
LGSQSLVEHIVEPVSGPLTQSLRPKNGSLRKTSSDHSNQSHSASGCRQIRIEQHHSTTGWMVRTPLDRPSLFAPPRFVNSSSMESGRSPSSTFLPLPTSPGFLQTGCMIFPREAADLAAENPLSPLFLDKHTNRRFIARDHAT